MITWLVANKEWLFSGLAVAVPIAIIGWIFGSQRTFQKLRSGEKSINIQVGGNVSVNKKLNDE